MSVLQPHPARMAPVGEGPDGAMLLYYLSQRHLDQVLFTFGLVLITIDLMRAGWGAYVEKE